MEAEMSDKNLRSILSLYRTGESAMNDVRFEEARQAAESDPLLARWWSEEKDLDQIIAAKLQSTHVPAGLVARITRAARPGPGLPLGYSG